MKLRLTPPAIADLAAIADYLRERNPAAARRIRSSIFQSLDNLTAFPQMGRKQQAPGVRRLVTRRYGYLCLLQSRYDAREVVVLRIRHPRRKRKYKNA